MEMDSAAIVTVKADSQVPLLDISPAALSAVRHHFLAYPEATLVYMLGTMSFDTTSNGDKHESNRPHCVVNRMLANKPFQSLASNQVVIEVSLFFLFVYVFVFYKLRDLHTATT